MVLAFLSKPSLKRIAAGKLVLVVSSGKGTYKLITERKSVGLNGLWLTLTWDML